MFDLIAPFIQQIFNGISLGSIYALISIGYTMVYGIIGMINFAHGEIYMLGAYIGFVTFIIISTNANFSPIFIIFSMMLVSIIITGTYGFIIERIAYRPLRNNQRLVVLISAIGMSIFLQNLIVLAHGARDRPIPILISGAFKFNLWGDFDIVISYSRLIVIIMTIVLMVLLTLFIKYSRIGRASRACSQDMSMANLLGIDTNKIVSFIFVIGSILAAIGGVLIAITIGRINPFIGFLAGIKAFTAAVLGGIGSIPGAMLGGILLGLIETLVSAYISSQYKDIITFSLLILVLLFRPTGLLGKPNIEKI
ncbi:MAG: branched-chain amino acid ABC transporter permease LivH [Bordetella sp.]|nr:MAG: branched-chain amino acid ABC transporter permease LivH [Bordetella sp.]